MQNLPNLQNVRSKSSGHGIELQMSFIHLAVTTKTKLEQDEAIRKEKAEAVALATKRRMAEL